MAAAESIDYKKLFEEAQSKIASLHHELAALKKLIFGSRQERFVADPVAPGVMQGTLTLCDEVITELKITPETRVTSQPAKAGVVTQRKTHPGRTKLPDHLRREVIVLEPGKDVTSLRRLGFEITEVLEYLLGELFVKQYLRPIYDSRRRCQKPYSSSLPFLTECWKNVWQVKDCLPRWWSINT